MYYEIWYIDLVIHIRIHDLVYMDFFQNFGSIEEQNKPRKLEESRLLLSERDQFYLSGGHL